MSFSEQLNDPGGRRVEEDYVDVPLCYSLSDGSGDSGPLDYLSAELANASRPCPVPLPSPIKTQNRTPKSNNRAQKSPITSPGGAGGVLRAMILLRGGPNRRTTRHRRGASSLSSIDMTACCEDSHCSEEGDLFGETDDVVFDLPNFGRPQLSTTAASGRIVPSPPPPSSTHNNNRATIRAATSPMRIHPLLRKNHPISRVTSTSPRYENSSKVPFPKPTPTRGSTFPPTRGGSSKTPPRGGSTKTDDDVHHTPTRGALHQGQGKKLSPPRLHLRRISRQGQPPPSQY